MNLRRMPRDFWVGLVILLGAALYWLGAASIPISALDGEINAAAVPRMLALALAVLAVILMVKALIDARNLAVTKLASVKSVFLSLAKTCGLWG